VAWVPFTDESGSLFAWNQQAYMVSLNTPVTSVLKPASYGIVTWGVPVAIIVRFLSLWQLLAI